MWQDDFRTSDVCVGEVHLNSIAEIRDFFKARGVFDERAILRDNNAEGIVFRKRFNNQETFSGC